MDTVVIAIPHFKTNTPHLWTSGYGVCPKIDTLNVYDAIHPKSDNTVPVSTFQYSTTYPSTELGYSPARLYIRHLARSKRWSKWELVIEFSITKLLLGNNLEEMPLANNAPEVEAALTALLSKTGVIVDFATFPAVYWCRADFSRNFLLTHCATNEIITAVMDLSPGARESTFSATYDDGGLQNSTHNKQRYSVFYNKIAEIASYNRRHPDLNQSTTQYQLSRALYESSLQVLRIECRLNKPEAIKRELAGHFAHGLNDSRAYTFEQMIDPQTAAFVIKRYLYRLTGRGRLKALLLLKYYDELTLRRMLRSAAHAHSRHYRPEWYEFLEMIAFQGERLAAAYMIKYRISADTLRNHRKAIGEIVEVIPLPHPVWTQWPLILAAVDTYTPLQLKDLNVLINTG